MFRAVNRAGDVYGRLLVEHRVENDSRGKAQWRCRCSCGTLLTVPAFQLARGSVKSCGCLRRDLARTRIKSIHGHQEGGTKTPTYLSWDNMIQRCTNPNRDCYADYGGRGISVCDEWRSFSNFLADMGERPEGTSIDRINNDGDYEPSNCRWATRSQQNNNQRARSRNAKGT